MVTDDDLFEPVARLAPKLQRREISPVELTEAYLARIDRLNGKYAAYVTVTRDGAMAEARQAEREIASGQYRGPLHGIPYGVKDLLATSSAPTTWGARPLANQHFKQDATVITKLRDAGAVLLGKLAMIELAGGLGYTVPGASATGAARNPWDTGRWTCGSSSGSAAAVAAGLAAFAIGSETWGSIICPSSFTGISGLRPTFGVISRHGAMVLSWTLDKLGPMARAAEDCQIILDALSGHDPLDDWSARETVFNPPALDKEIVKSWRVAVVRHDFAKSGEPDVAQVFDRALEALGAAGIKTETVRLPDYPYEPLATLLVTCEAAASFEELFADGRVRQLVARDAPLSWAQAKAVTGVDLIKAMRVRTLCQKAMAEFFSKWDVLLSPGEPFTAFPADRSFEDVQWTDPVGAMGNVCGLPAIAVPCGFGRGELPVSLQIVAGAFQDGKAIQFGRFYQSITNWHRQRPPL